jgi:PAS domain S-box-containing protein
LRERFTWPVDWENLISFRPTFFYPGNVEERPRPAVKESFMQDNRKTKSQLIEELAAARWHIAELKSQPQSTPSDPLAETLRQSEKHYRALVEVSPDAMMLTDLSGTITFVNELTARLYGYETVGEMLGANVLDLIVRGQRARMAEFFHQAIATDVARHIEAEVLRQDGTSFWSDLTILTLHDEQNTPTTIIGITRDITTRKQIDPALRQSEQRYKILIENQSEGLGVVDANENFVFANPAADDLFGQLDGLTGHNLSEYLDADQFEVIKRETLARQHGQKSTFELFIRRPDGQARDLRITAVPEFDEQGVFVSTFGMFRDITARRQAEDEVRRLNAELEQRVIERTAELEKANAELQEELRQRQRIEELLRRSEQRYRVLFDSAGDAIFILTLTGQIEEANRFACEHLGYSHDELLHMNIADVSAPEQRPYVPAWLEKSRHQELNFFETVHQRRDGSLIHVEVSSRVVEYGGRPTILSIARDITAHKQIEETLRRSEASLAEAQRIAHFGSWTWDLVTGKLQCSDEMFRLVGLLPQEMEVTQEVFAKFLPSDEVEWIFQEIQHVSDHEPSAGLEHRLIRSNGETRYVYSRVKVYRDEHDRPLRLLGSTQDITDRKQAEQVLRQYADEQAVLLDSAFQLTSQLSTQDVLRGILKNAIDLMMARTAVIALYEPDRDELVVTMAYDRDQGVAQKMIAIRLRPGDGAIGQAFQRGRTLVINDYPTWEGRPAVLPATEQLISALVAVPLLGRHTILGVLFITSDEHKLRFDEHDAKLIELFAVQAAIALENAQLYERQQDQYHRLQDAQARLVQAEKMSALGRLIASISHEINNPLQAVQGCLTLVREGIEEAIGLERDAAANLQQDLDVAAAEVQRIAGIVQQLRDFYRPARAGLQATDVAATIDVVLALTAKQLQRSGIAVERIASTAQPLTITTNADQLKQIALNMVLNAIDAMPAGGHLHVSIRPDTLSLGDRPQPAVRIDFTDTGHGIPPDNLARIFEPFFTTKDTGSGLGLSISYELAQALGGDISVVSDMGSGTTFTLRLPTNSSGEFEVTQ